MLNNWIHPQLLTSTAEYSAILGPFSLQDKRKWQYFFVIKVEEVSKRERRMDATRDMTWWIMPWRTLESDKLYLELWFYHLLSV